MLTLAAWIVAIVFGIPLCGLVIGIPLTFLCSLFKQ